MKRNSQIVFLEVEPVSATIMWDDPPESGYDGPQYKLVRVRAGRGVEGTILSPNCTGLWTHYDGRRSVPCLGEDACEFCKQCRSSRWVGYLLIQDANRYVFMVEITEGFWDRFMSAANTPENVRGFHVRIFRATGTNRSKLLVEIKGYDDGPHLSESRDLKPNLIRIWGLNRIYRGANIMTSKSGEEQPNADN